MSSSTKSPKRLDDIMIRRIKAEQRERWRKLDHKNRCLQWKRYKERIRARRKQMKSSGNIHRLKDLCNDDLCNDNHN